VLIYSVSQGVLRFKVVERRPLKCGGADWRQIENGLPQNGDLLENRNQEYSWITKN